MSIAIADTSASARRQDCAAGCPAVVVDAAFAARSSQPVEARVPGIAKQQGPDQRRHRHRIGRRARTRNIPLEQRAERPNPHVERRDVVELEDDRIDDAAAALHHPYGVVDAAETFVCPLVELPGRPGARVGAGRGADAQQARIGVDHLARQHVEPAGERLAAPLREDRIGLLQRDRRHLAPVAGLDQQGDRILGLARVTQQEGSALERRAADGLGQRIGRRGCAGIRAAADAVDRVGPPPRALRARSSRSTPG